MISVSNLVKKYPVSGTVVDDISFSVGEGECLVLVGSSGCGKSTTLKMINGLINPDSGEVRVFGKSLFNSDIHAIRKKIGYVIQQAGLFPHLTVFQNISLLASLDSWSKADIQQKVYELLELVDLSPDTYALKYPLELSGGEKQRVGIARALMLDPPVLLMDEPFGALDPLTRRQLQKDFLRLQKAIHSKKTIVFVTHDMQEAFLLGNRIAVMEKGKIVQLGTPKDIKENPATDFVSDFFDEIQ